MFFGLLLIFRISLGLETSNIKEYEARNIQKNTFVSVAIDPKPIIFVLGRRSETRNFRSYKKYFLDRGYKNDLLFLSSDEVIPDQGLICYSLRQLRSKMKTVINGSSSKIDIVAFSFHSLFARKAILGGNCENSHLALGPALTKMVATFISVAGINDGISSQICADAVNDTFRLCKSLNCGSDFVTDLNSQQQRFEATRSFSIFSRGDELLNKLSCCERKCAELPSASGTVIVRGLSHLETFWNTPHLVYELLNPSTKETAEEKLNDSGLPDDKQPLRKSRSSSSTISSQYGNIPVVLNANEKSLTTVAATALKMTTAADTLAFQDIKYTTVTSAGNATDTESTTKLINFKPSKNSFNPVLLLFFASIALLYFAYKFFSRCICDIIKFRSISDKMQQQDY